jgi:hypothetical protein
MRGRLVEIVTRYSNTPNMLADLRRTVDAVTTMAIEDDQPHIALADRAWRVTDRLSPAEFAFLLRLTDHAGASGAVPSEVI